MNMLRTIFTGIAVLTIATYSSIETADAAPRHKKIVKSSLQLGTPDSTGASRGLGFDMCIPENQLVSENLDMLTVTPGNSVNCFGGGGTPEHRYGRSHDLSLGATAGMNLEIACIHFALAHNDEAGTATVNVYLDLDGMPGPAADESDLWPLGSVETPIPITSVPVMITASPIIPFLLSPDSLIFVEIVIPASSGTNEIGSNAAGELSTTWLRTTNGECGIGTWTNPAMLGFPDMHILEAIEVAEAILPDPCDDPLAECAEDVDGDGLVAVSDVLMIIGAWGDCGDGTYRPDGDIAPLPNGDCCVDVADILAVIGSWGVECDPGGGIEGLGINEIRIDMSGTDYNEYVELIGDPGTVLDGYSYIVIGDGAGASGVLETIVDLTGSVIGDDGLLSIGRPDMTIGIPDLIIEDFSLENSDNVTHLLVGGLIAELNQDLDVDDDGVLDDVYWSELLDEVGLLEVGYEGEILDLLYTDIILGPVGIYPPAHVFRCPDAGEWKLGVFADLAMDTPGELNMCDVPDLDEDGVYDLVDNCYLPNPDQLDCNSNGVGDLCDIADGTSSDCNNNEIADDCEDDCNGNGLPDECDVAGGEVDCDGNGIPDVCETDCNDNGVVDACDVADGTSADENGNGVPDECEVGILAYTSFEEPALGGQYVDPGDPMVDHQLFNIEGQANVEWDGSGPEMGFTAWYVNTRDGVGLTDGDWVGVTNYAGTVGSFPDGSNGYEISDADGLMRVDFDTATGLGEWNVSVDLFVQETGWEDEDTIVVDVVVDGGVVLPLLDTTGLDIDDLEIEGGWFNLLQDLSGYTEATLRISLDCNSGSEAIYFDNVFFSSNAIMDSDGDGIPDSQDNCELPNPDQLDCNGNDVGDVCDLADGVSFDCNANGVPDECEADCNSNGVPDECDIASGTSQDVDGNGVPDECEIVNEFLVITAVYDGPLSGGTPKGIELYALSDIADLSLYGVGFANNGGGSDGEEFTFDPVSAVAGQFIYVASDNDNFLAFFGFAPDFVSSSASINGDDAVELFENGIVIDTFGDINTDGTDQPWEYLDGWASRLTQTGPDGINFVLDNWSYSGPNALDGETSNDTAVLPVPIGAYFE